MAAGRLRPVFQYTPLYQTLISATVATSWIEIGEFEGSFSIQVVWNDGNSVTMTSELEISNDKIHYSTYPGSSLAMSGASGNNFYDLSECGAQFMRVRITVTSGDAKISTLFNGKARV